MELRYIFEAVTWLFNASTTVRVDQKSVAAGNNVNGKQQNRNV